MKMKLLPVALGLGFFATLFSACEDILGVHASGDVLTEVRNVKNFHALDISTNGQVTLRVDSVYRVEVSCEESVIDYLQTVEDHGVLKIHFDRDVYDVDDLKITVSAPAWDAIDISGSVRVNVPDPIEGDQLDLAVAGSGDVKVFQADFKRIDTRIAGSGNISVDGSAEKIWCTVSGSGDIDALGCPVQTAVAVISGSGNIRLDVSETLDATISGSGDVEYRGNATVTSKISGSGKVRKI